MIFKTLMGLRKSRYDVPNGITTTPKCVLVHFGFHYILSEFGHFNLVKLIKPLMNRV
jgi:hypothetical protein